MPQTTSLDSLCRGELELWRHRQDTSRPSAGCKNARPLTSSALLARRRRRPASAATGFNVRCPRVDSSLDCVRGSGGGRRHALKATDGDAKALKGVEPGRRPNRPSACFSAGADGDPGIGDPVPSASSRSSTSKRCKAERALREAGRGPAQIPRKAKTLRFTTRRDPISPTARPLPTMTHYGYTTPPVAGTTGPRLSSSPAAPKNASTQV